MARNLARFDPLLGLEALKKEFLGETLFGSTRGRIPTTDVYTKGDDALIIEAHLPNFDEKDVSVTVDRGALVIQAERREKEEDKGKNYVVRESSSSFYRSIELPELADDGEITAAFKKGVLKVKVPLREGASPRSVPIGASKETHGDEQSSEASASDSDAAASQNRRV